MSNDNEILNLDDFLQDNEQENVENIPLNIIGKNEVFSGSNIKFEDLDDKNNVPDQKVLQNISGGSEGIINKLINNLFKKNDINNINNQKYHIQLKVKDEYKEIPKKYINSLKFYYENMDDFKDVEKGGLNLSNKHREWYKYYVSYNINNTLYVDKLEGVRAFNNVNLYRPVLMDTHINNHYILPYKKYRKDGRSPFMYDKDYIKKTSEDLKNEKFSPTPPQKFCSQYMSYQSDMVSLLVYHGLGSGKTAIAAAISEGMKAYYTEQYELAYKNNKSIITGKMDPIINIMESREVYSTSTGKKGGLNVILVVPKNLIDAYRDEIIGSYDSENNILKSITSHCVICNEVSDKKFIQMYVDLKNNNENKLLQEYDISKRKLEEELGQLEEEMKLNNDLVAVSNLNQRMIMIKNEINVIKNKLKDVEKNLNKLLGNFYFIISKDTFINLLSVEGKEEHIVQENTDENEYDIYDESNVQYYKTESSEKTKFKASAFVKGIINCSEPSSLETYIGMPPSKFFFKSEKSLIIVDEIHRLAGEKGIQRQKLMNTLNYYARSETTGMSTTKVVLMTATPVFDNPHELALSINLLKPRIPFPIDRTTFSEMFIDISDQNNPKIKNQLLFKYMVSGYISYFKGGNPNNYAYRRNHVILHKMQGLQLDEYIISIQEDINRNLSNEKKPNMNKMDLLDKLLYGSTKESLGNYDKSISLSLSALPKKSSGILKIGKDDKVKIESSGDYENARELIYLFNRGESLLKYSTKLYNVALKIIESSLKNEGVIYVQSIRIARGLLPIIYYLLSNQNEYKLLDFNDLNKDPKELLEYLKKIGKNKKTICIWTGKLYEEFKKNKDNYVRFIGSKDQNNYKSKLRNIINSKENINGDLCKVLFGNITEGVSFSNVSQIHLLNPWWNIQEHEQIIARGIRTGSHFNLPESRRHIDVYYHCSILPDYPNINTRILGSDTKINNKKINKKINDKYVLENKLNMKYNYNTNIQVQDMLTSFDYDDDKEKENLIKQFDVSTSKNKILYDLSRLSIDQKIYSRANIKNNINNQCDMLLKEASIDGELNENGNIIRLEEYSELIYPIYYDFNKYNIIKSQDLQPLIQNEYKIFYNRSINKYYRFHLFNKSLEEINIIFIDKDQNVYWPPLYYEPTNHFVNMDNIILSIIYDENKTQMINIILKENIKLFSKDTQFNNLNFEELKSKALQLGEDEYAWNNATNEKNKELILQFIFKYLKILKYPQNDKFIYKLFDIYMTKIFVGPKEYVKQQIEKRNGLENSYLKEEYKLEKKEILERLYKRKINVKDMNIDLKDMTYNQLRIIYNKVFNKI